ncbi:MAG: hypothetical protein HOH88_02000 [Flavobacteriales bacterium]|nr:hypothetical protein [Flavobacteriales bacterium]
MEKEFYVFILPWIIVVILYWKFPITDNIIDVLSEENKRKKTEKITHRLVLKTEKELKEMESRRRFRRGRRSKNNLYHSTTLNSTLLFSS